jgi:hypothetical protein
LRLALLGLAVPVLLTGSLAATAGPGVPRVVEVPSRPAFVQLPRRSEIVAQPGLRLATDATLRTQKPGRLQVQLANGRSFRLGGDAVLRLGANGADLVKGQIIAWVNPGQKGGSPLKIKTRVATASIVGTTVFIEATPDGVKFFSWEGQVQVTTPSGQRFDLNSGQQLAFDKNVWVPPRRLTPGEVASRRRQSILLNGFEAPMETLPVIERELGLKSAPHGSAAPAPASAR